MTILIYQTVIAIDGSLAMFSLKEKHKKTMNPYFLMY